MAQILGVPYIEVAIAAVVPALLYYFAVMVQVHFEACRLGLRGIPWKQLPPLGPLLKTKGFLLIPLVAIIYFLLAGYTPLKAAFNGILVSFVLSWLNKETRLTPAKLYDAFQSGARSAIGVACACATVGMVVGMGTLTGLALKIAGAIVAMAEVSPDGSLAALGASLFSLAPGRGSHGRNGGSGADEDIHALLHDDSEPHPRNGDSRRRRTSSSLVRWRPRRSSCSAFRRWRPTCSSSTSESRRT